MSDAWDRELDGEAYKRLSPARKRARARLSFERKVAAIEVWARDGVPADAEARWSRPWLRRWSDPALRLWRWSDPNLDHPARRNADLVARFDRAVSAIRQRHPDSAKAAARGNALAASRAENRRLVEQNAELLSEVIRLRQREAAGPAEMLR